MGTEVRLAHYFKLFVTAMSDCDRYRRMSPLRGGTRPPWTEMSTPCSLPIYRRSSTYRT